VSWLFLEYLDEGWQLDLGPETAIVDAAAMLGELHRAASSSTSGAARAKLNRYDQAYFHRCLAQAEAQVASWGELVPSFDRLVHQFQSGIRYLVAAPRTVVHGEFTPHNVVWARERPRVVDWEQAATGPGEIDLAALTDDWPPELVEPAAKAYVASRWTGAPGHDFAATLHASRLYWLFRWLGDPEQAGTEDEIAWLAERANEASAL
jgi:aminoglycoside phosphotransferase (APT) family kinase protein